MILNGMNYPRPIIKKKLLAEPVYGSLKDKLIERLGEMKYSELNNLVIEGVLCDEMSLEDKQFIELFTHIEFLAFNDNRLNSLKNLPNVQSIQRVSTIWKLNNSKSVDRNVLQQAQDRSRSVHPVQVTEVARQ